MSAAPPTAVPGQAPALLSWRARRPACPSLAWALVSAVLRGLQPGWQGWGVGLWPPLGA